VSAEPRYATPRTDRETLGHEVAAVAEQLGQSLMPWQRQVADVATELQPGTRIPAYREVVVTVPRQSGKTTLMLAVEVQRCLRWPGAPKVIYSAQTGSDSRRKLLDDQVPLLKSSPVWAAVKSVYRAGGREAILFRPGSRIDVLASNEGAGHGRIVDLAVLDEAHDDVDDRREAAVTPAMATRPAAQLLVISTAGTEASAYLRRKVDTGRDAVVNGETEGIAYFEWSAEDDADPDDPAVWRACMPALGFTINEATVRHARATMGEGEFRRAFLNMWTTAEERVIPAAVWRAVCREDVAPDGGLVLGIDCNPERSAGSIAVGDSSGRVELIEYRDSGVGWIVERVAERARTYGAPVVLDGRGPAASLLADLEAKRVRRVVPYSASDMTTACAAFYDAVADRKVAVRTDPALDDAVAAARRRQVGDSWMWGRRDTGKDVSPLVALTLAFHRATNRPPRPRFINLREPYDPSAIPPPGHGVFWP
jgi:hypothetical protein